MKADCRTNVAKVLTIAVLAGAGLGWAPAAGHQAATTTRSTKATLTWTEQTTYQMTGHQMTWNEAVAAAAAHAGGGFTDWRLPTIKELQNALADGSWGQGYPQGGGTWNGWTSKSTGPWAYAVEVTTDETGTVIPEESGSASKVNKASWFNATKFVRP